jgi:hypothetical protein
MTITLNSEQRHAIESHKDGPVYVVDTDTEQRYVLVPENDWDRVRALLGIDDFEVQDAYAAQSAAAGAAGWDDPSMDVYDEYDAHRPQP